MQPTKTEKVMSYIDEIFPPENFQNYQIKKIIGKGSYGHVAKAVDKVKPGFVAIKKITNLFSTLPETRRILRELILLKNCEHPNIVRVIDVIIPKTQNLDNFTEVYLVTEFCDSDLHKVFKTDGNFFEMEHIRHISYQIMCGYPLSYPASSTCIPPTSSTATSSPPTSSSTPRASPSKSAISGFPGLLKSPSSRIRLSMKKIKNRRRIPWRRKKSSRMWR